MKNLTIFIFILLILGYTLNSFLKYEHINNLNKTCIKYSSEGNFDQASICYRTLTKKYNKPKYEYDYALELYHKGNYEKALDIFKNLEKINNSEISYLAKTNISTINATIQEQKKKDIALNNDVGDYYFIQKECRIWETPRHITVYIDPNDQYYDTIYKAFKQWDWELTGTIGFDFVDNKDDADIIAYTSNNTVIKEDSNAAGVTRPLKPGKYKIDNPNITYLGQQEIEILKQHSGRIFTADNIYSIALHEIGHAIGLREHSPDKGDIMFYSTDGYRIGLGTLSRRDINTVKKIYQYNN